MRITGAKKSVLNERNLGTICDHKASRDRLEGQRGETKARSTTTTVFQIATTASEIHLRIYRTPEDPVLVRKETLKSTLTRRNEGNGECGRGAGGRGLRCSRTCETKFFPNDSSSSPRPSPLSDAERKPPSTVLCSSVLVFKNFAFTVNIR